MSVVVLSNVLELDGNPYVRLWNGAVERTGGRLRPLTVATVRSGGSERPVWVHLQWPERVLRHPSALAGARNVARLTFLLAVARLRGARVMVTAHNVWSHDGRHRRIERVMWAVLGLLATDLHLLSAAGGREFVTSHPTFRRTRRRVIPHGTFAPVQPPERDAARAALGLPANARVVALFGLLRAYKGVEELLAAFAGLDDPGARLVVAGRVADPALEWTLDAARRRDPRVLTLPRFLPDDELAAVVSAADRVVLPYRRVLNSGAALFALGIGRPVLLPRSPSFEALQQRVGGAWVALYDGPLSAADLAAVAPPDGAPDLSWCGWDVIDAELGALWREGT